MGTSTTPVDGAVTIDPCADKLWIDGEEVDSRGVRVTCTQQVVFTPVSPSSSPNTVEVFPSLPGRVQRFLEDAIATVKQLV